MKGNLHRNQHRLLGFSILITLAAVILLACSQSALAQATQNKIPKWTDNAGTLGPSTISEDASGNIGIGTTAPGGVLDLQRSNGGDILQRFWNQGTGGAKLRYVAATGATSQIQLTDNAEWLMSIAGNNSVGMQFRVRNTSDPNSEAGLDASAKMTIGRDGKVGIGTTTPVDMLDVNGSIHVSGNINAKFQDVAEWVPSTEQLPTGTVVVLDSTKSNQVVASTVSYDTRVAGVISAQPGIALGEKSDSKVLVATSGRVRMKVDATRAPIHIGDLLVTSDLPGVAMKSEAVNLGGVQIHRPGTLIGKALEPLPKGSGEILVLLSLQ